MLKLRFPNKKLQLLIEEIRSHGIAVYPCSKTFRSKLPLYRRWEALHVPKNDDEIHILEPHLVNMQNSNILFCSEMPNYRIAWCLLHELGHHHCVVKDCECKHTGVCLPTCRVSPLSESHATRYSISECLRRKFYAPLIGVMRYVCNGFRYIRKHKICNGGFFVEGKEYYSIIESTEWKEAENLFHDELYEWISSQPEVAKYALPALARLQYND